MNPLTPRTAVVEIDENGTAHRLIASARTAFARLGYEGASIRLITRRAHANLGAVTYHFGSKRGLYEAMLQDVLTPLVERVVMVVEGPGSVLGRMDDAVRTLFVLLRENPDMPHLILQELAAGKGPPAPVARALGAISGRLAQLIREGQAVGEIRAGDPTLFAFSVMYQPVYLALIQHTSTQIVGFNQSGPGVRNDMIDHAVAFARAGLALGNPVAMIPA